MQFVAHEDVDAPVDYVFTQLSDFTALERSALRRGADIQRTDSKTTPGPGMTWKASYDLRRTLMNMALELTQFDPPNGMVIEGHSTTLDGLITLDLVALSRLRTRISLRVDVRARTLPARLFLQSFKLARVHPGVTFKRMAASYATRLEERYKTKK
ncbi:MAG: SRPBCC family protein [Pseudomonadota bacterium]